MIDLDKLKRLAQKATPGPWSFWHGWVATDIDNDGGVIIAERPTPSGGKYQARVDANFDYMAAANPAVILELIDRLEAAEKVVAEAYQRGYATGQEEIVKDRDDLLDKVGALESIIERYREILTQHQDRICDLVEMQNAR